MLNVATIVNQMKAGTTSPFLVTCDGSLRQYVMKCQNDTTNGKALFNEIFASRLAKLLNIETPEAHIGKLPDELAHSNELLLSHKSESGYCFLSEYKQGSSLSINKLIVRRITNIEKCPDLIFFDALLMNSDRADNPGNWFITKKSRNLIAIDHTSIFRLAQVWDTVSLHQDMTNPPTLIDELDTQSYKLLVDYYKTQNKDVHHPFHPIARRFASLSAEDVESCFENIPKEWGISSVDFDAAKEFINFQISHANDILNELDQKYKFQKGGHSRE